MPRSIEFNEEEALKKAMTLFWEKGYSDTSIQDLVKFLGISNASIYNSFGTKKKLFNRALEYYQTTHFAGLNNFLGSQNDAREGFIKMFSAMIDYDKSEQACKGCFIVNSTTELLPTDPEIQKALDTHKSKLEAVFLDLLQRGVEDGQIAETKDIKVISSLLYTVMTGLRVLGKGELDSKEAMASVKAVLSLLD